MLSLGRSPLVLCPKQLGDVLLLQPMLATLREQASRPVALLTRSGHRPLLALMGETVRRPARSVLACYSGILAIGETTKTSLSALLNFSRRKQLVLRSPDERRRLHDLVFQSIHPGPLGEEYVARYYWKFVAPKDARFRPPRLARPPEAWKVDSLEPRRFLLVNPTAGWKRKCWKPERWAKTCAELHSRYRLPVVVSSGSEAWQRDHAERVVAGSGDGCRTLAGLTSLEQFLWLAANARLILTVDGVATHLGQALRTPTLTLFGPTSAVQWHFEDASHQALVSPGRESGMGQIQPDAVLEAAQNMVAPD